MGVAFSIAWDDSIIIFIQQFMTKLLVAVAGFVTEFGDATILVGVVGLHYWALNKDLGKKLLLSLSFANIVNPCLKCTVKRLRPYMVNPDIRCLKPVNSEGDIYDVVSQEFSFPSGHAVNCISVYGPIARNSSKKGWKAAMVILTVLVGISRFALGVHYPSDVIAGWIVGIICVCLYAFLEKKIGRYRTYILLDVIGLLGFLVADTNDYYTGYGMMLGSTLGIMFEEKYVRFGETEKFVPAAARTVVGAAIYLGLNALLKMPFTEEFLNSGTLLAFAVRAARYAVICFLLLGLYPKCFGCFSKKEQTAETVAE